VTGQTKTADGKTVDQTKTVTAQVTYYHKSVTAGSTANVTITDAATNSVLQNSNVTGPVNWEYDWATYKGDSQALSSNASALIQRKETYPNEQDLFNQSIRTLQNNLGQQLKSFYSQY
jgi:hypothetical protein